MFYPAFEEVTIDKNGHISTKHGPSMGFVLKTWIFHKITLSAVSEQRDCKPTKERKKDE